MLNPQMQKPIAPALLQNCPTMDWHCFPLRVYGSTVLTVPGNLSTLWGEYSSLSSHPIRSFPRVLFSLFPPFSHQEWPDTPNFSLFCSHSPGREALTLSGLMIHMPWVSSPAPLQVGALAWCQGALAGWKGICSIVGYAFWYCSAGKKSYLLNPIAYTVSVSLPAAQDALSTNHLMVKTRPLSQATRGSKSKAQFYAGEAKKDTNLYIANRDEEFVSIE